METRLSDEAVEKGLGRDARHAAELGVLHHAGSAGGRGGGAGHDLVDRPSAEEAAQVRGSYAR
jgi:hypothetical protein